MEYTYSLTTAGSGSTTRPVVITSGGGCNSTNYVTASGGSGGGWTSPDPRTPTALEWLDAEVESVCKLAR